MSEGFEVKEVAKCQKEIQCVLTDKRTIELLKNIVRAYCEVRDPNIKLKSINIRTIELNGDVKGERLGTIFGFPITICVDVKEQGR